MTDNLVFSARDVTKAASFELAAFEAPQFGPLGRVEPSGKVTLRRLPPAARARLPVDLDAMQSLPRVDIVMSYAGADRVPVDAFVAAGSRGLVSAGLLPGRPANGEMQGLADAARAGVIVVQATRAPRGVVPSQDFLRRSGMLAGSDLAAPRLRILLMLILTFTTDPEAVQHWIDEAAEAARTRFPHGRGGPTMPDRHRVAGLARVSPTIRRARRPPRSVTSAAR